MERVPTELLHRIFITLELEERIQCTLVCRRWWCVLDEYSLLNCVDITCNEDLFLRFMGMVNRYPHRAMQVEDLCLMDTIPTGFNQRTLLNTFPNLRVLDVENLGQSVDLDSYNSQPIQIKQSTSKLRSLYDNKHCEITSQLLSSNLGGTLKELYLNLKSAGSISTRTLLDQLSNLPVLNKLTLHQVSLEINDIENIHHNIPSIRVFGLYNITIADSEAPVSISPATSITTLSIDIEGAVNARTLIKFYQYMTDKYCKVGSIKYNNSALSDYNEVDKRRIYLNGILDFYKAIASAQRALNIHNVPPGINILGVFDEMDCQLEELSISNCQDDMLQYLARSNQSRCIQKLTLKWIDTSSIHCINNMEVLTTLKLELSSLNHRPIPDLADCLNACPSTLKRLTLNCKTVEHAISNVHLNCADTLEISCKRVDRALADAISSCFPNLVNLTLHGQITENICVKLTNPSFQKAKFDIPWRKPHVMAFKAPNQVVPQHYLIIKIGCKLVDYEKVRRFPLLTVICFTEKVLKFSNWVEILPI